MAKRKNTRQFSYTAPIMYQGATYPSTRMGIADDEGNVQERNVFADRLGQYYTLNSEGNAIPIVLQQGLPEVTVTASVRKVTPEERNTNLQKQAYMRASGFNVPQDGSWGPYQQSVWDKLTIKPKEYDTTLMGLAESAYDKFTGNDTYRTNPLNQGLIKTYNPDEIDWGKTRRSQNKVVNAVSGTWGPIVAAAMAPYAIAEAASAPLMAMVTAGGGMAGGYAVNKASEALTGRDFGTNVAMHTPLTPGMGELLNPGYVAGGKYGSFVGNNLANRERYFLNGFTPAGYFLDKKHLREFARMLPEPFYKAPPTFFNGRKPRWYGKYVSTNGTPAAENRFQNGAIWGGIPENEVPITMYRKNYDGTYRMTSEGIGPRNIDMSALPEETMIEADFFTKGMVGGEHSNYTKLAEQNGIKLMQFEDEQKLNPQWKLADGIKKKFNIPEGSKAQKTVDYLGGKPLDWLAGYKPFTIKQDYLHDGNYILPVFRDPINPHLPIPVRSAGTNVGR